MQPDDTDAAFAAFMEAQKAAIDAIVHYNGAQAAAEAAARGGVEAARDYARSAWAEYEAASDRSGALYDAYSALSAASQGRAA